MGRRKLGMELIKDPKKRKSTLEKSKKTLKKMAHELSILCDVPVCAIVYPMGPNSEPETYPADRDEVQCVIDRYTAIPMAKRTQNLEDDLQPNKRRKVSTNFPSLDGLSREELARLVFDLDCKLFDVAVRMRNYTKNYGSEPMASFDDPCCHADEEAILGLLNGGLDENGAFCG